MAILEARKWRDAAFEHREWWNLAMFGQKNPAGWNGRNPRQGIQAASGTVWMLLGLGGSGW